MVWFSSLTFIEFSLSFSVLYINKLFGYFRVILLFGLNLSLLIFNKGNKPMVAWNTSKIFGFDKRFGVRLCVANLYERISSSIAVFLKNYVCIEVLLKPCEINQIRGAWGTMSRLHPRHI